MIQCRNTRLWAAITSAALMALTAPSSAQEATSLGLPVEAFAALPKTVTPELSPDGRHMAVKQEHQGSYRIAIFQRQEDGAWMLVGGVGEQEGLFFDWIEWASNERLLFNLRTVSDTREFGNRQQDRQRTETRLLSVRPDGSDIRSVIYTARNVRQIQIQDNVVDMLHDDPDHILLSFSRASVLEPSVFKVNVNRADAEVVQAHFSNVRRWMTDTRGTVRVAWGVRDERDALLYMKTVSGEWKEFHDRVQTAGAVFRPMGFNDGGNMVYVASNHEGGTAGAYTFDISTGEFVERICKHPALDVSRLIYNHDDTQIQGVSYGEGVCWIDTSQQDELRMLGEALGAGVAMLHETPNGRYATIRANSGDMSDAYYIFDRETASLEAFDTRYPALYGRDLGSIHTVSYAARDGLEIPAFVTLPPNVASLEEARRLPFIIHPHGGPTARDFSRFDYWTAYFASRGYGVLQMNFRGSAGYGEAFRAAGDREWGQAMQDDITDGANWLIEQGYADPDRIAIVGASYGGYAALMGAAKTPDLYQCAVSFAGVSDLPALLRYAEGFIDGRFYNRHIGQLWRDSSTLRDVSPTRLADDVKVPVLLVHGEDDQVVPIDQSRRMARALPRNLHELVILEGGDHYLSNGANRLQFFQEMDAFLSTCLAT